MRRPGRPAAFPEGAGLRASLEKTLPPRAPGARVLRLANLDAVARPALAEAARINDGDVNDAWAALRESLAPKRARVDGETVAAGDDVDLDTVLFVRGKPMPFGGRALRGAPVATADDLAPGLAAALVGAAVGGSGTFTVAFPDGSPRHAGVRGVVAWSMRAASERKAAPAERDVPKLSGLGANVEAAKRAIRVSLEAQGGSELRLAQTLAYVDALAAASDLEGVDEAARTEVRSTAMALEGNLWLESGASADEIEALIARWLEEPGVLDEAHRRAARALTLRALAERHGIVVNAALRRSSLASAAALAGVDVVAVQAELRSRSEDARKLDELLLPFAVLEWLSA